MTLPSQEESTLWVAQEDAGKRLDQWLALQYRDFSRTYFQGLVEDGLVLVNGRPERKRYVLQAGDEVEMEFRYSAQPQLVPQDLPLSIIYEDDHILVINKAVGMVVHPAAGCWSGTVANALAFRYGLGKDQPTNDLRPGIVHRLDKDTSGLLVTAKTSLVHARLVEQFAARSVEKIYLAICCKNIPSSRVELAIERDPVHRQRMRAGIGGKAACTLFESLASSRGSWPLHLLRAQLLTGRTHQIRVHLRACDSPLLGDSVYGWDTWNEHYKAERQMLHAWQLKLQHPVTGQWMHWKAPLPMDMLKQMISIDPHITDRIE